MKIVRRGDAEKKKGEPSPSAGNVDRSLRILPSPSYPLLSPPLDSTVEEGDRDVI